MRWVILVLAWSLVILFVESLAHASCFDSDVKSYCCPSACAVKKSSHWYQADAVLQQCMQSIGCGEKSSSASVFMKCNCK